MDETSTEPEAPEAVPPEDRPAMDDDPSVVSLPSPESRHVVYHARPGSHLSNRQAQLVGERLTQIGSTIGQITSALVVEDAAPEGSPLHPFFTWDDAEAAKRHRIAEARQLIRDVVITIQVKGDTDREVRAFFSVVNADREPVYVPLGEVRTKPQYSRQVATAALRELNGWRERYEVYQELTDVVNAVGAAVDGLSGMQRLRDRLNGKRRA